MLRHNYFNSQDIVLNLRKKDIDHILNEVIRSSDSNPILKPIIHSLKNAWNSLSFAYFDKFSFGVIHGCNQNTFKTMEQKVAVASLICSLYSSVFFPKSNHILVRDSSSNVVKIKYIDGSDINIFAPIFSYPYFIDNSFSENDLREDIFDFLSASFVLPNYFTNKNSSVKVTPLCNLLSNIFAKDVYIIKEGTVANIISSNSKFVKALISKDILTKPEEKDTIIANFEYNKVYILEFIEKIGKFYKEMEEADTENDDIVSLIESPIKLEDIEEESLPSVEKQYPLFASYQLWQFRDDEREASYDSIEEKWVEFLRQTHQTRSSSSSFSESTHTDSSETLARSREDSASSVELSHDGSRTTTSYASESILPRSSKDTTDLMSLAPIKQSHSLPMIHQAHPPLPMMHQPHELPTMHQLPMMHQPHQLPMMHQAHPLIAAPSMFYPTHNFALEQPPIPDGFYHPFSAISLNDCLSGNITGYFHYDYHK